MNSTGMETDRTVRYRAFLKNSISWIVDDRYASLIPDELVKALLSPGESPFCRVIRENRVRRSMLLHQGGLGEGIFAKLYKQPPGADRYKYLLLPSKSSAEWKHMLSLYERGLPVARPLALGEKRRHGFLEESFLFCQELKNAQPLNALQDKHYRTDYSRALTQQTALLVSAVHNQGFFFRDCHAGNIVLVPEDDGGFRLCLVDFHKVWHTRWVFSWMRARDLAQLRNSIPLPRTGQWRFLKIYAEQCGLSPAGLDRLARRIDATARKMRRVHLRSRTRRCLKESTEFAIQRSQHYVIYRQRVYPHELISMLMEDYRNNPARLRPLILKKTDKEAVTAVTAHYGGIDHPVVIKESSFSSLRSRIRYSMFRSRAKRSWVAARALRVRGIPTPDTLALIEYWSRGMIARTILLMQYLAHAQELNDYVLGRFNKQLSAAEVRQKEDFIAALAGQVRTMHERGVYHADLKSNNILVREDAGRWTFYVIDLDRIHFKQRLSFRERSNNLAQINASIADCITTADRLLFFKLYAHGTPLIRQGKKYFQSIMEIGRKKNTRPYGMTFPETGNPAR